MVGEKERESEEKLKDARWRERERERDRSRVRLHTCGGLHSRAKQGPETTLRELHPRNRGDMEPRNAMWPSVTPAACDVRACPTGRLWTGWCLLPAPGSSHPISPGLYRWLPASLARSDPIIASHGCALSSDNGWPTDARFRVKINIPLPRVWYMRLAILWSRNWERLIYDFEEF